MSGIRRNRPRVEQDYATWVLKIITGESEKEGAEKGPSLQQISSCIEPMLEVPRATKTEDSYANAYTGCDGRDHAL